MDNPVFVLGESDLKCSKNDEKSLKAYPYEEAIEKVGVGKFHYALLLIAGMCFMACVTEITGLGLIMFPAKCDLKFTLTEQGLLGSAGFLGVTVSSHFMGFLADTWGRVRSLRMMLLISLVMSLISVMSVNVWMLFIFRFLTGCFISGGQACVFSLVGEFHSIATRVKHVALVSIFLPAGLIYFPVGWLAMGGICCVLLYWIRNLILVLIFMTVSVAIANCIGIMSTIALEFYPTSINAMGVSFVMMIGRLGAVVGTNIVGPLLFSVCETLFFTYGGVIALLCILAFFLPRGAAK
uniref:Major facilitator superfamily (MFS) profile domain-containing protein n=1 Tax=Megaselia scalaris TaxID=36166 RepID=T1GD11_MEGSC